MGGIEANLGEFEGWLKDRNLDGSYGKKTTALPQSHASSLGRKYSRRKQGAPKGAPCGHSGRQCRSQNPTVSGFVPM